MSFVSTIPNMVTAAADNLIGIHSALGEASAAAAAPTTAVAAAGADEISAATAQLFSAYGQEFHALSARAAAFHAEFVRLLNGGAAAYLEADLAGANAYSQLWTDTSANLQGIYHTWSVNPAPFLRQFVANQQAYATTVGAALTTATQDFGAGLVAVPAAYQTAFQALTAGNVGGAVQALGKGYLDLVFTGFNYDNVPTVTINGALGDLLPILSIPGDIAQNMTNVLKTVTDTSITAVISLVNPSFTTGLPLTLALDALGAPIVTAQAAALSGTTLVTAVQTGNVAGAFGALADAPAVIANGFLNGQGTITLDLPPSLLTVPGATTQSLTASIPIGGILTPLQPVVATAVAKPVVGPPVTQTVTLGGTQFGGLIPGLQGASAELATAITPLT